MPATWVFHRGETTHTLSVVSWSVTRSRQDGLRWSVTLAKPEYWPSGAHGQYFEPWENTDRVLDSWVTCTLTSGANSWSSPKLAILDASWDLTPEGLQCELSGTDEWTELLQYEGVLLGDRRSTSSTVYTANGVLSEIATACGFASGKLDVTGLTNYNLPVFRAIGQGLSLLRSLLEVTAGWALAESDKYYLKNGGIDPTSGSADLTLNTGNCKAVQYRKSSAPIYNQATFERISESKQGYGPEILYGYGNQTINLPSGLNEAILRVRPFGPGTPENMTWDDESGNPLTVSPTYIYRGSTLTHRVRFSLTPSLAWGENPMPFEVEVIGSAATDEVAAFDEDYTSTYNDTADQAIRGVVPFPDVFTSEQVPDQATGLLAATNKVKESLLLYSALNVDLLMDVTHDPGQKAAVTIADLGLSSARFLVESVAWSGDANQEIESLELARGPA